VKPFYYAHVKHRLVFSNTLDCIRLHPAVGDALNELAIGDFLLFGFNQDSATTTFADVQRLAPAHCLTSRDGTPRPKRYWTLPTDGRIRYRRSREYVDHFRELLGRAVGDRLRSDPIGVWMSGGLDSTSITATAHQLLSERSASFELRAYTIVYNTLIPDEERHYSRMAAEALGIGISYFVADGYGPLDGWDQRDLWTPEPADEPFLLIRTEQLKQAASRTRVLLCGEGGDEVLWRSDVADLLGKMGLLELGADVARSLLFHRQRPGVGLRSALKTWLRNGFERPPYPGWLNRAFADRLDLRARWEQLTVTGSAGDHSLRPEAYRRLAMAFWPSYFESSDPGVTGVPVEARYPFLDVRLVRYLLAIPPIPWCVNKQLLRVAMRGTLPDPIRLRRKAPLAGDQLRAHLRQPGTQWLDRFDPTPKLAEYVDRAAVPQLGGGSDGTDPWLNLRPLCLDYWLRRVHAVTCLEEGGNSR
jgi:asparagine synthase (glutamine-hydrolysing)